MSNLVPMWFCKIPEEIWEQKEEQLKEQGKLKPNKSLSLYRVSKETGVAWETVKAWANGSFYPILVADVVNILAEYFDCDQKDITSFTKVSDSPNKVPCPVKTEQEALLPIP